MTNFLNKILRWFKALNPAPSAPDCAPSACSPTHAELFVVYTDAQGLWANRVSRQPGRPRKLSFSIEKRLLSLSPASQGTPLQVCFVSPDKPSGFARGDKILS
jgi:hypothetical protein